MRRLSAVLIREATHDALAEARLRVLWSRELPGVNQDQIQIEFENGLLTIRGERNFQKQDGTTWHRVERTYGSFTRSFTLPNTVDPEQVSAHYEKGVLKIRLAKKAEAKPKLIKVNVEKTLEAKSPGKVA